MSKRPYQRKIKHKGVEMLMIDAIKDPVINPLGFHYNTIKRRMDVFEMTFDQAVSSPRKKNPRSIKNSDYSGTIATNTDGNHPEIMKAVLTNNNAFLRVCEEFG